MKNPLPRALLSLLAALPIGLAAQTPIAQQAYLKAHDAPSFLGFGTSVAASGDTVVVAASRLLGGENGAAYVFVRNGTTWTQQTQLRASNQSSWFGSCAISGDTIVVGAAFEASNATGVNGNQADTSAPESGAAYVFVREGTTWTRQAYLKASNSCAGDLFGGPVAISGDTIVVGAQGEDSSAIGVNGNQENNSTPESGAAYVFVRSQGLFGPRWTQQAYLKASNPEVWDGFGTVAISGDTIVVGAPAEDSSAAGVNANQANNGATYSGAAYVFVRNGTEWTQQAYLKASNPGGPTPGDWPAIFGDLFGSSVAISGDTIVVGAEFEDSRATGVDGDQENNSVHNAGAAYVFVREGTTWSQQAYLKASNTTPGDEFGPHFGFSVAISGDTVAIGSPYEDSNGAGVDGTQNIYTSPDSGAAYVFVRSGITWSQRAYLKASNPGFANQFGFSIALSGGSLIVGAREEDSSTTGVNSIPNNSPPGYTYGAAYVFTGLLPPPPALAIQTSENGVRLSWPVNSTGWVLEQSETMESTAAWSPIPAPYRTDTAGFFHSVPNPGGQQFFRLSRP